MSNPGTLLRGGIQKGTREPRHLLRVAEARGALAEHSGGEKASALTPVPPFMGVCGVTGAPRRAEGGPPSRCRESRRISGICASAGTGPPRPAILAQWQNFSFVARTRVNWSKAGRQRKYPPKWTDMNLLIA
jgi:hypothetical protein